MAAHSPSSPAEVFKSHLDKAKDYPLSLAHTEEFQHVLQNYSDNMLRREDDTWCLFGKTRQPIWTWHLPDTTSLDFSPVRRIDDVAALRGVLDVSQDATCRFLYIQNSNARSGLGCNRQQLTWIFTYYQVLPAMIDIACAFRVLEYVPLETRFRSEACLRKNQGRLAIPEMGRSGYRFQHCFRLIGVERQHNNSDASSLDAWSVRHAAAYHSMDVKENRSVWIIIKGRRELQEQLEAANKKYLENHPDAWKTTQGAFLANLNTHLLFFKWCSDNWTSYIDALEAQMRSPTSSTRLAPMTKLTDEPALSRLDEAYTQSRQETGLSDVSPPDHPRRSTSNISQWISQRTRSMSASWRQGRVNTAAIAASQRHTPEKNIYNVNEMFSFDELQRQHRLMEKYRNTITALARNARILREFQAYVGQLTRSSSLRACVNISRYHEDIAEFLITVRSIEEDLKTHSSRMDTMLKTLENTISLFTGILEYNNSRLTEHFARQARASTNKMETWTKEMHKMAETTEQQTVSMHIITAVALFFLPGTFVTVRIWYPSASASSGALVIDPIYEDLEATSLTENQSLFDSNILSFEDGEVRKFGFWAVNMGALKLFFLVCLPIMFATMLCWLYLYWRHRVTRKKSLKKQAAGA